MHLTLMYGPTRVESTWAHRPKRLKLVKDYLERLGFIVGVEPILPRDRFHYKPRDEYILHRIIWAAIDARSRFAIKF